MGVYVGIHQARNSNIYVEIHSMFSCVLFHCKFFMMYALVYVENKFVESQISKNKSRKRKKGEKPGTSRKTVVYQCLGIASECWYIPKRWWTPESTLLAMIV